MHSKVFVRTGGILMVLSGALYVGTMVTNLAGLGRVAYAWLGLAATVLLVPAIWGLGEYLRAADNELPRRFGVIAMLTGVPFLIGIYLQAYLDEVTRGSEWWSAAELAPGAATKPLLEMIGSALDVMALVTIVIGSFLTFGVAPLALGLASLRAPEVPRWPGWVAICGGILGLVWIGFGWTPIPVVLFIPSAVLVTIWMLIVGTYMLRAPKRDA